MATQISRNPMVAYQQGIKMGRAQSNVADGFLASNRLLLLSIYNVIDNFICVKDDSGDIDDEQTTQLQGAFVSAIENEMARLFEDEFKQDLDMIEVALGKVWEIRKKWHMDT